MTRFEESAVKLITIRLSIEFNSANYKIKLIRRVLGVKKKNLKLCFNNKARRNMY